MELPCVHGKVQSVVITCITLEQEKGVRRPSDGTGFVPFIRKKFPGLFQDFSRTQIDFSRALKFTLTPTLL